MTLSRKPIIGITLGDPCGIGPEIIVRSLQEASIRRLGHFQIIGSPVTLKRCGFRDYENCTIIDPYPLDMATCKPGQPNPETARASLRYLEKSVDLLKKKKIQALVTGPVCKEAISEIVDKKFQGHTEFLAQAFHVKNFEMMFVGPTLKTIVVTRHVPLKAVSRLITAQKIYSTILLTHQVLKKYFKIQKPKLAVCGLNPHAGEGGKIGREEITQIIPAIKKAKQNHMNVSGPFPADTVFTPHVAQGYDIIIAMYHDQGLVATKAQHFNELVNLTVGLPFIRTSPAHGTAFNIAGKNMADPSSMTAAIKLAAHLSQK